MEETTTVIGTAETTAGTQSENIDYGAAAVKIGMGIVALVLIYIVAENSQKIAAAVDKLFGLVSGGKKAPEKNNNAEPSPARVEDDTSASAENYRVYDIYEGELNLDEPSDNDDDKDRKDDING
ncbi:MAG: hypothetical protein ACI4KF_10690 [Huintestinicola sp.]